MAKPGDRASRWRWPRRLLIAGAVTTLVVALLGFLVIPPIARHVAANQLGQLLGRKVSIARVRLNPFALSLTVEGFEIFEADQTTPFLGFSRLYVNAQLASIYRRAPVIQEISLEAPHVRVVRMKATSGAWADVDDAYNFSDILARLAARPSPPAAPPAAAVAPPRFSLNNIHLSGGSVTFDDRPLGSHHALTDLSIGVPFVSTLPVYLDSFVEPGLSVRVDGTPFVVGGRTKPFKDSLETVLELRLSSLDLTRYVPFVPLPLGFSVDSARFTLALDVSFVRSRADAPTLKAKGRIALEKVDLRETRDTRETRSTRDTREAPEPAPRGTPLLSLDKLEILIAEANVTAQRFDVERVLVSGLDVHVRRLRNGTLNLEHLVGAAAPGHSVSSAASRPTRKPIPTPSSTSTPASTSPPLRFSVGSIVLEKTSVHLRDEAISPAFEDDVRDISLSVHGLSNAPGATARVTAGLRAIPGGTLRQQGTLQLTPLSATGTISIDDIEPGRFAPYYRDRIAFDIAKGRLRLGGNYLFAQGRGPAKVEVSDAFVELIDLALRRRGAPDDFVRLGQLAVRGGHLDLGAHTVTIAALSTRDARIRAARDAHGVVDLTTLTAAPAPATPALALASTAPAGTTPAPSAAAPASPDAPATGTAPAWVVTLARFDLERWGVRFDDRAVTPRAVLTVDPITMHATNLSMTPGSKLGIDLRMGINKTGLLAVTGTSVIEPLAANLRFDLRALEILPLQPYFRDQVNLTVTDGKVSVKGQAVVKKGTGPDPHIDLDADIDVTDLATVDRDRQEPLLGWRAFHVGGLKFASAPLALAIKEVALTDLRARVVLLPDSRLNLQEALASDKAATPASAASASPSPTSPASPTKKRASADKPIAASAKTAAPAAPPPQISIAQFVLRGANVTFNDRVIHPSYTAELTDLTGRVTGLSSSADTTADVDLRGAINRSGLLTIAGQVNPLAKQLFVDLRIDLKDVELPPASPYAGTYVGYGISKGKLGISLSYKIANRKLDAQNRLVLDQFTFGDRVDSPQAVKLPVRLAVSLLKDRHGVIDIDLPIAGSLDDPDFKVGHAILKVLGNLLLKAVTAPFSLIAAAFGGGDQLSRIEFPAGVATLDGKAQQKMGSLTKALQERPGISFEIKGGADPARDRDGLRRFLFERKLKTQKMGELVEAGQAVSSPDRIEIDPAERPRLLEKAYKLETFAKPKNAVGLQKTLTPAEMEALILANTRVDDEDLRALALRRATAVQTTLARTVAGGASRLFLVTPALGGPGGHVELDLKKD